MSTQPMFSPRSRRNDLKLAGHDRVIAVSHIGGFTRKAWSGRHPRRSQTFSKRWQARRDRASRRGPLPARWESDWRTRRPLASASTGLARRGLSSRSEGWRMVIDPYLSDTLEAKYANTSYSHRRMAPPPRLRTNSAASISSYAPIITPTTWTRGHSRPWRGGCLGCVSSFPRRPMHWRASERGSATTVSFLWTPVTPSRRSRGFRCGAASGARDNRTGRGRPLPVSRIRDCLRRRGQSSIPAIASHTPARSRI